MYLTNLCRGEWDDTNAEGAPARGGNEYGHECRARVCIERKGLHSPGRCMHARGKRDDVSYSRSYLVEMRCEQLVMGALWAACGTWQGRRPPRRGASASGARPSHAQKAEQRARSYERHCHGGVALAYTAMGDGGRAAEDDGDGAELARREQLERSNGRWHVRVRVAQAADALARSCQQRTELSALQWLKRSEQLAHLGVNDEDRLCGSRGRSTPPSSNSLRISACSSLTVDPQREGMLRQLRTALGQGDSLGQRWPG